MISSMNIVTYLSRFIISPMNLVTSEMTNIFGTRGIHLSKNANTTTSS